MSSGGLVDLRALDQREKVDVKEWKGHVFLRAMSGEDHRRLLSLGHVDEDGKRTVTAGDVFSLKCDVLADCVVDHAGEPIYDDSEWWARCRPAAVRNRLWDQIVELSCGTPEKKRGEGDETKN